MEVRNLLEKTTTLGVAGEVVLDEVEDAPRRHRDDACADAGRHGLAEPPGPLHVVLEVELDDFLHAYSPLRDFAVTRRGVLDTSVHPHPLLDSFSGGP